MRAKKMIAAGAATWLLAAAGLAGAQTYSEGFGDVAALPAAGWLQVNSGTPPTNPWFQGNSGILPAFAGAPDAYIAADFLSSASGPIDNWLITPVLSFSAATTTLSFAVASARTPGFSDVIEILRSVGSGSDLGSFASFVTIDASGAAASDWLSYSFTFSVSPTMRFAFRQRGTAETADYLGLDSVQATFATAVAPPIPEPETWALMGAGVAALAFAGRRRKAHKRSHA